MCSVYVLNISAPEVRSLENKTHRYPNLEEVEILEQAQGVI